MPTVPKSIPVIGIGASIGGLGTIVGAWLYLDSYFAKEEDVITAGNALESSVIELQLDFLDLRIELEQQKENSNPTRIERWRSKIRLLEIRYRTLQDGRLRRR